MIADIMDQVISDPGNINEQIELVKNICRKFPIYKL